MAWLGVTFSQLWALVGLRPLSSVHTASGPEESIILPFLPVPPVLASRAQFPNRLFQGDCLAALGATDISLPRLRGHSGVLEPAESQGVGLQLCG